jgi:hypothetical protein
MHSRSTADATLRQGSLKNIPRHRAIMSAWKARGTAVG